MDPRTRKGKIQKKNTKIQKTFNKKNINNISKNYSGEKRMPERLENDQKLVKEVQKIQGFDNIFSTDESLVDKENSI